MLVVITDPAKASLSNIYQYYRRKKLGMYGRSIRLAVYEKSKTLKTSPYIGQVEEEFLHLNKGHRYLVVKSNYKVIYRVDESKSIIFITDVFDTRQNPNKMKP
ncbi:MAG: type II toxin-antitoxin system RelE/ParE family toxin [Saprospiraceae bacterium]